MIKIKETSTNHLGNPQFVGYICIATELDEDNDAVREIVKRHLQQAWSEALESGYECKLSFGRQNMPAFSTQRERKVTAR